MVSTIRCYMRQNGMNSDQYTEDLGLENSSFNTGNICSMIGQTTIRRYLHINREPDQMTA